MGEATEEKAPNWTVWKFELQLIGEQLIRMPRGAELLDVQWQFGTLQLWARLNPNEHRVQRRILTRGTGHEAPSPADSPYVATYQQAGGSLVFHVFDGGEL